MRIKSSQTRVAQVTRKIYLTGSRQSVRLTLSKDTTNRPFVRLRVHGRPREEFWLPRRSAPKVLQIAQENFRCHPDLGIVAALKQGAVQCRVKLISQQEVVRRSAELRDRTDVILRAAAANSGLQNFHHEYKKRRLAAKAKGESFIGFAAARKRFAAMLVSQRKTKKVGEKFYDAVFGTGRSAGSRAHRTVHPAAQ